MTDLKIKIPWIRLIKFVKIMKKKLKTNKKNLLRQETPKQRQKFLNEDYVLCEFWP